MMKDGWVYRRGDLYLADLGEPEGSRQGGVRPVIVLQNDTANYHSPPSRLRRSLRVWARRRSSRRIT